jgi:TatD DNase family protein
MTMRFFDTHCHLGDVKLKARAQELLQNAAAAGVEELCVICADSQNIREFDTFIPELRHLAQESDLQIKINRTAGLHPHEAQHWNLDIEKHIEQQLRMDAIAVGETGLDYHYNFSEADQQKKVFSRHIDWSCEFQKPLVIHCREAAKDVLHLLDRQDVKTHNRPGILHCFTENLEVARELVKRNFMISFSGIVTFNNAAALREVAAWVPTEHLLIETDAPYLAPMPLRGKMNEPAFVKHTFDFVCQLRKADPETFAEQLWQNSQRIYHGTTI